MSHGFFRLKSINFRYLAIALSFGSLAFGPTHSNAADITWGGTYRFEGVKVNNADLSGDKTDKAYMLHHLVLMPKLVAADGFSVFSRLDILNNPTFGITADGQVNSVAGDVIGNGPATTAANGGVQRGTDSNAWGRTQRASPIAVTTLYASWAQEFGQFVVGRAPLQFGLGTMFSAGNGAFDHYIDTRDMVAYKMVLGNLFIMPILGKMNEGMLGSDDDVNDYMVHVQYDNPESDLSLGFLYDVRVVLGTGNDAPTSTAYWGPGFTTSSSYRSTEMGFFFKQNAGKWLRASIEADLLSGDTGVRNAAGNGVGLNSFGIAAEFALLPAPESKWNTVFKLGMATGDDPGTADIYEGYAFNRNYDVAMLLFNHPLGKMGKDFLRTGLVRDVATNPSNQIDSEALSNAMYFAPSFTYKAKDYLSYGGAFIYGMLNKDPFGGGVGTSNALGYEVDLNISYKPVERMTWITEAGFLFPGDAWKGGSNGFNNSFAYGLVTKAAINF